MRVLILFLWCSVQALGQDFVEKTVKFKSKDKSFFLEGTLTIPQKSDKHIGLILISGSGQSDRDQTIGKHKNFKTIAEYLSSNGITVLRYDDRGGGKSGGKSTINSDSYALSEDTEAAMKCLKKQGKVSKIGLLGHSEGGMIAAMVASRNKKVSFIITLAGPSVSGEKILIQQNKEIFINQKIDSAEVAGYLDVFFKPILAVFQSETDSATAVSAIIKNGQEFRQKYPKANFDLRVSSAEKTAPIFYKQINNPWFRYFILTDPLPYWKKITCNTLTLFGSLDLQVNPQINANELVKLQKSNIETEILTNHNHLFQTAKNGSINEYFMIKEDISDLTLQKILNFIKSQQ